MVDDVPIRDGRDQSSHLRRRIHQPHHRSGVFSPDDVNRYRPIVDGLYDNDWFMVTADFESYWKAQRGIDSLWQSRAEWGGRAVQNTANVGWFSSDRTIREYARDIWNVPTR